MGGFLAFVLSRATGLSVFAVLEAGYLLLGLVGATVVFLFTHRSLPPGPERCRYLTVFILACGVGLAGARLIPIVQDAVAAGRLTTGIVYHGGLVFYGGLLVGLGGMWVGCRLWGLSPWPLLDAVCRYTPLGHAFGRLGCFFGGCCFGSPTNSLLGVRFPAGSPAYEQHALQGLLPAGAVTSLAVHPSQLYDAVGNLLLFMVLLTASRRPGGLPPGKTTTLYLLGYAVIRFVLECWRGDLDRGMYFGLSTSQYVALAVMAATLVVLFLPRRMRSLG